MNRAIGPCTVSCPDGRSLSQHDRRGQNGLDKKLRKFIPGYMTIGTDDMADMGEMGLSVPKKTARR